MFQLQVKHVFVQWMMFFVEYWFIKWIDLFHLNVARFLQIRCTNYIQFFLVRPHSCSNNNKINRNFICTFICIHNCRHFLTGHYRWKLPSSLEITVIVQNAKVLHCNNTTTILESVRFWREREVSQFAMSTRIWSICIIYTALSSLLTLGEQFPIFNP